MCRVPCERTLLASIDPTSSVISIRSITSIGSISLNSSQLSFGYGSELDPLTVCMARLGKGYSMEGSCIALAYTFDFLVRSNMLWQNPNHRNSNHSEPPSCDYRSRRLSQRRDMDEQLWSGKHECCTLKSPDLQPRSANIHSE